MHRASIFAQVNWLRFQWYRVYRLRKKYLFCDSDRSEESLFGCKCNKIKEGEILRVAQNDRVLSFSAACSTCADLVLARTYRVAGLGFVTRASPSPHFSPASSVLSLALRAAGQRLNTVDTEKRGGRVELAAGCDNLLTFRAAALHLFCKEWHVIDVKRGRARPGNLAEPTIRDFPPS